jgi:5-formyltetrahydrofolate cyclo-ligase
MFMQTMKQTIRQSIIAARQKMAVAEHDEFSRRITRRILQLEAYNRAETVLGYMSFGAEFATLHWLQQALQAGKQILLPKVNSASKQLELYQVSDLQRDVAPGLWKIPEPLPERCNRVSDRQQLDFILLPGVAFARDGARLGYGGGFYDKLLARISPPAANEHPVLAAAAFSMQIIKDIPQEATDRKVEWLLTENEVKHCSTR